MNDQRFRQPGETHAFDLGQYQRLVGGDSDLITGVWRVLNSDPWNERDRDEALIWPVDVTTWDSLQHHSGMIFRADDFSARVKPDGSVEISDYRLAPNRKAELDSVKHELVPLLVTIARAARYQAERLEPLYGSTSVNAGSGD